MRRLFSSSNAALDAASVQLYISCARIMALFHTVSVSVNSLSVILALQCLLRRVPWLGQLHAILV